MTTEMEWWQRGPVEGYLPIFQPAVHAILQARDELHRALQDFPDALLWQPLHGMASTGFHLQHITGVLNRLLTYANAKALTEEQLDYLRAEGKPVPGLTTRRLLENLDQEVEHTLASIRNMKEDAPLAPRAIGRKKIPTTQFGLVFHAAEHMMRHTGQVLVTSKVLLAGNY
jgi:uncharacterized damage-inducible protein DinB